MTIHPRHGVYLRSLNVRYHDLGVRCDENGMTFLREGKPHNVISAGLVTITSGSICLTSKKATIGPGMAIIPFPPERFAGLARSGAIDQLAHELQAPVLHVVPSAADGPWDVRLEQRE